MKKTYIVAEISANHNQDYEQAVELVYAAKKSGADAVKLQTYTPDTLTIKSSRLEFKIKGGTPWDDKTLYKLYEEAYMPWEWQPKLKKLADKIGIDLFSTPFDKTAVDFLEEMNVSRYKISSFELVDIPLIAYVASKKKPIIMSTGMATTGEIREAVCTARDAGATEVTLLKCTSSYPTLLEDVNLLALPNLSSQFIFTQGVNVSVGLSDHTLETSIPVAAVALGAKVIEKHITLSRNILTADSSFSLEPDEFTEMVESIRAVEKALGGGRIGMTESEESSRVFRRSLFIVKGVKKGDKFTEENIRSIRPGHGLPPKHLPTVLGCRASRDIERGTPFQWDFIEGGENG